LTHSPARCNTYVIVTRYLNKMDDQRFTMALTKPEREKHEAAAKARGISLSSFYRLAANEYLAKSEAK
jgi:hypothetical protein